MVAGTPPSPGTPPSEAGPPSAGTLAAAGPPSVGTPESEGVPESAVPPASARPPLPEPASTAGGTAFCREDPQATATSKTQEAERLEGSVEAIPRRRRPRFDNGFSIKLSNRLGPNRHRRRRRARSRVAAG